MDLTLWNAGLSLVVGVVSWVLKDKVAELSRISILLNKTREEIAKDYVTKTEVHADINRVMNRLEVLDAKLDRLIENIRVKGPGNG
jgi:hypothetical protein